MELAPCSSWHGGWGCELPGSYLEVSGLYFKLNYMASLIIWLTVERERERELEIEWRCDEMKNYIGSLAIWMGICKGCPDELCSPCPIQASGKATIIIPLPSLYSSSDKLTI